MNEQSSPALAGSGVVAPLAMDREFRCHHCHAVRITDGVPASRPQDVADGGRQGISDQQLELFPQLGLFPPPSGVECLEPPEAEWSRRYHEFAKRYAVPDFAAPEALTAVIDGLHAWLRMLPQRSHGVDGTPQPANEWGLGTERCFLRALNTRLVAAGEPLLAARIRSEITDLLRTAESLDRCCMQPVPDLHAEGRLIATARIQVNALAQFLADVQGLRLRRADKNTTKRKRGHPPCQPPGRDRQLMEEWAAMRGKLGTTRKEFCVLKGLSYQEFIQAQDRFRKQISPMARSELLPI